jgi:hypothetical protein
MVRKAARGRKTTARARTGAARRQARTTIRTGRKTSSARASKTAPRPSVRRGGVATETPRPGRTIEPEATHEPLPAAQHDEDEDLDWLGEDEDPRSQIVEDDDDWEPQGDDEW